jgi:hypothetical protein
MPTAGPAHARVLQRTMNGLVRSSSGFVMLKLPTLVKQIGTTVPLSCSRAMFPR